MSDFYAHPTAVIDEGAQIGARTKIWHFCHIMPNSRIGEDCVFGQNCLVAGGVTVGNNVKVQNNVSLYTGLTVEDDAFLGPSAVFTNVINPRSFVNRKDQFRDTLVRRGASIGANATIVCGVTLGAYCFVGAGAVVTRDVPDYALVVGAPARIMGWVSKHGHRLHFDDAGRATCPESGEQYERTADGVRVTADGGR